MTPDKNFKMKPSTKALLAVGKFRNAEDRHQFKRMMIDAQMAEQSAQRRPAGNTKARDFE